jgi:D-alanyl-D-alanine dipeptidase
MIRELIYKWLRRGMYNQAEAVGAYSGSYPKQPVSHSRDQALNFTLYPAVGGHVVEFNKFDRLTDRTHSSLYIVQEGDDFAKAVAEIVTLESLTRH